MPNISAVTSQDLADRTEVLEETGTATTVAAEVSLEKESGWIDVTNTSATINLLVSLDGGTNYNTVFPKKTKTFRPARNTSVHVKTASSTATYEITYGVKPS